MLYLIEILHQTTTKNSSRKKWQRCILSKFYIKPQQNVKCEVTYICCILSKFYIKPQHEPLAGDIPGVVSYRNSTSNHNMSGAPQGATGLYLIEILHQTTTAPSMYFLVGRLYLIEILHQTTTPTGSTFTRRRLYLIEILHQTTTRQIPGKTTNSCILSKFYIKPQLRLERELARCSCILSKFYIKPQLRLERELAHCSCILSKFYIKPQLVRNYYGYSQVVSYRNSTSNHNSAWSANLLIVVVSYRNSTSNHNLSATITVIRRLYLIEILHQTTT